MPGTLKGKYKPRNPQKYKGNPTEIYYRSSWELQFMKWVDKNDKVIWWQSEEKAIWYYDPVSKKKRRYFPDFIVYYERSDGTCMTEVVEVKPQSQVDPPPKNPKRRTKAWMNSVRTYLTNQAKWQAAANYCENEGYNFRLLTEKNGNFI